MLLFVSSCTVKSHVVADTTEQNNGGTAEACSIKVSINTEDLTIFSEQFKALDLYYSDVMAKLDASPEDADLLQAKTKSIARILAFGEALEPLIEEWIITPPPEAAMFHTAMDPVEPPIAGGTQIINSSILLRLVNTEGLMSAYFAYICGVSPDIFDANYDLSKSAFLFITATAFDTGLGSMQNLLCRFHNSPSYATLCPVPPAFLDDLCPLPVTE